MTMEVNEALPRLQLLGCPPRARDPLLMSWLVVEGDRVSGNRRGSFTDDAVLV